jgi:uncharacterized protein
MDLAASELRVLGSLVEKQLTTPQQYPLTLNALTAACNQSSNRYPVVSYDEQMVESAVTSAKTRGLARFVHPSHGRSSLRFAHTLEEVLGLETRPLALLAVLMLRGPQTLGELRSRTERMTSFDDLADVERELNDLAERTEPLVARLRREPGQKEERFAHLLGPTTHGADVPATAAVDSSHVGMGVEPEPSVWPSAHLTTEQAVSELRGEVAELRRQLEDLRSQLGA